MTYLFVSAIVLSLVLFTLLVKHRQQHRNNGEARPVKQGEGEGISRATQSKPAGGQDGTPAAYATAKKEIPNHGGGTMPFAQAFTRNLPTRYVLIAFGLAAILIYLWNFNSCNELLGRIGGTNSLESRRYIDQSKEELEISVLHSIQRKLIEDGISCSVLKVSLTKSGLNQYVGIVTFSSEDEMGIDLKVDENSMYWEIKGWNILKNRNCGTGSASHNAVAAADLSPEFHKKPNLDDSLSRRNIAEYIREHPTNLDFAASIRKMFDSELLFFWMHDTSAAKLVGYARDSLFLFNFDIHSREATRLPIMRYTPFDNIDSIYVFGTSASEYLIIDGFVYTNSNPLLFLHILDLHNNHHYRILDALGNVPVQTDSLKFDSQLFDHISQYAWTTSETPE